VQGIAPGRGPIHGREVAHRQYLDWIAIISLNGYQIGKDLLLTRLSLLHSYTAVFQIIPGMLWRVRVINQGSVQGSFILFFFHSNKVGANSITISIVETFQSVQASISIELRAPVTYVGIAMLCLSNCGSKFLLLLVY
jgi:hypothetical protein